MKRWYLMIVLSVVVFTLAEDIVIKDISPEMEEYPIVLYLVKNGIMDLEDGKFGGSVVVSRYELARYLYRLIKFLGRESSTVETPSTAVGKLEEIYYLLGYDPGEKEFTRLVLIEDKLGNLEKGLAEIERKLDGVEKDLKSEIEKTSKRCDGMIEDFKTKIWVEIDDLSARIDKVSKDVEDGKKRLDGVEDMMKSLMMEVTKNSSEIRVLKETLDGLQRTIALVQATSNLQPSIVRANLEDLKLEIGNLKVLYQRLAEEIEMERRIRGGEAFITIVPPESTSLMIQTEGKIPTDLILSVRSELKSELGNAIEEKFSLLKEELEGYADDKVKSELERFKKEIEMRIEAMKESTEFKVRGVEEIRGEIENLRSEFDEKLGEIWNKTLILIIITGVISLVSLMLVFLMRG